METSTNPTELKRPVLHKLIDELPDGELDLVGRVLARLEMDRLWRQVQEDFTRDWDDGKFAQLDEIIREVRTELKQPAA